MKWIDSGSDHFHPISKVKNLSCKTEEFDEIIINEEEGFAVSTNFATVKESVIPLSPIEQFSQHQIDLSFKK